MLRKPCILLLISLLLLTAGCADVDPEIQGTAFVNVRVEEKRTQSRSATKGIELTEAVTALVVLRPAQQCPVSYEESSLDYDRELLDLDTNEVELLVPLDVQLKMCLYFFSDDYSLSELASVTIDAEGYGESDIFNVNLNTSSLTVDVDYWSTLLSTLTANISSSSSAGLVSGSTGSFVISDLTGQSVEDVDFTVDNTTHTITVSELAYGSYTYEAEMGGFTSASETFTVLNSTELLDVELTPIQIDVSWISFDNLTVTQVGTTANANASGTIVLEVPLEEKDNVTQFISTLVIKNTTYTSSTSNTVDVTPSTTLPTASSTDDENVTYEIDFSTSTSIPLTSGSNDFYVTLTIGDGTKQTTVGSVYYDACIDSNTMCFFLTWTDGSDPDLHTYYFPDWEYQDETSEDFDNTSRGTRYHIYQNDSDASDVYSETGDTVHLTDGIQLPSIDNSTVNYTNFTADAASDNLTLGSGTDFDEVSFALPVYVSTSGTLPGGMSSDKMYFLHSIDNTSGTVKLADNVSDAIAGTAVDITADNGSGTHTLTTLGSETQVWATNSNVVGDGTYVVWVEDVTDLDLQGVRIDISGPALTGLSDNFTYGPFNFKNNDNFSSSPYQQPLFFIQVDSGTIQRSDNISVGDNLSGWNADLKEWIGDLTESSVE